MTLYDNLTSEQLSFVEKWKNQGFEIEGSLEVENGELVLNVSIFKFNNVVPITFDITGPVEGLQKADFGIIDEILQRSIKEAKEAEKFIKRSLKRMEKNIEELIICHKFGEDFARRNLRHPGQYTLN